MKLQFKTKLGYNSHTCTYRC